MTWRTSPLPADWESLRIFVLGRDPICRWGMLSSDMAEPNSCQELSKEVDHIGEPWDHRPIALRGLCQRHHATRTGRQGAAGKTAIMLTRRRPKDPHPGFRRDV
jgi:5-methylcytosine-specific restriction enzyme A